MTQREDGGSGSGVALVVISDLEFGGAQRQAVELCNRMDPARFDVHVCSLSDYVPLAESIRDRGRRFHTVLRRSRFDWTVVFRLRRLIRQLDAKLIHAFLFDAEIAGRLAGRGAGIPVIASERNTNYPIKRSDYLAYRLTGWARDLTIANSSAGADFNSRTFGLPRSSYRVVHNGVDTERFCPRDGADCRRELGLPMDSNVVGMFGSFKPQKNHPFLLRAARQVVQRLPGVRFLFVGDELFKGMSGSVEFKAMVERLVDELGLRAHCVFAGNRADVERVYNACDVLVLPSLFEGTPNVALEAMASGLPVVATRVSDNDYVIPDGRVGWLVELGDESGLADRLGRLLENPELTRRMGSEARAWVTTEFSGRRLAERTAEVYEEALALRGRRVECRVQ